MKVLCTNKRFTYMRHDAHVAILLSTAKVLSEMHGELRGTVRFIFS